MNKNQIILHAQNHTLLTQSKLDFLWEAVCVIPEGDIVEVGSWMGGSSLVLTASANLNKPNSKIYICDTFKGIALAGPNDNHHKDGDFTGSSKEHVHRLLSTFRLSNFKIAEGIFPNETAELVDTDKISFLHIDVDVYEGYMSILKWAQDKLVPGAIIVFDDYSAWSCKGAKLAVDEYFSSRSDFELFLRKSEDEDLIDASNTSWARYTP